MLHVLVQVSKNKKLILQSNLTITIKVQIDTLI